MFGNQCEKSMLRKVTPVPNEGGGESEILMANRALVARVRSLGYKSLCKKARFLLT